VIAIVQSIVALRRNEVTLGGLHPLAAAPEGLRAPGMAPLAALVHHLAGAVDRAGIGVPGRLRQTEAHLGSPGLLWRPQRLRRCARGECGQRRCDDRSFHSVAPASFVMNMPAPRMTRYYNPSRDARQR